MSNYVTAYGFDIDNPQSGPTVSNGLYAGNMSIGISGQYQYCITFVTNFGETQPSPLIVGTTTTGSMILSDIPISLNGDAFARKIYRSYEYDTVEFSAKHFVTTINDNTTTTYIDVKNDAELTYEAPLFNNAGSLLTLQGTTKFTNPEIVSFSETDSNGSDDTDAQPLFDQQYNFVFNNGIGRGVRLPARGSSNTLTGNSVVVSNQSSVFSLNVYPSYPDNLINGIVFPDPYIINTNSNKTFIYDGLGSWSVL
jgi:hypothetical protein